ncbi:TRAP transporter large permease [Salipiger sp.]|uniref:TRAP transporter large permease n=1 Tax=Salipiger sp. TaxID=2078585 RepID=UPI003A976E86
MTATFIAFAGALLLIFLRLPIAVALVLVGAFGLFSELGLNPTRSMLGMAAQGSTMSYSLSVLPLFVLMGNLVAGAGISGNLFRTAQLFLAHRRGGLGMATILASGGFGAICGSSVATAATMSRVAIPPMREWGYSDRLAAATVAAGGTLGILIPPSVVMVIYGISTQSHIGMLFAAGFVPGLLGVIGYLIAVRYVVWRNPAAAPRTARSGWPERLASLVTIWPVLALFTLVIGGIYGGFFTATEAAGIGATGALVFAVFSRSLSLVQLGEIFVDTALVTTALLGVVFGANVFVEFVNMTGVHTHLQALVQTAGLPPLGVIAIIVLVYLVLGCLLETISMILITLPVFFPVVTGLGYDPIWFGVIVVVAAEIGLITPPIGINLFVIRSVNPDIPISTIFRGVAPFVVIDILRLALLVLVPVLSLWLPNLLF